MVARRGSNERLTPRESVPDSEIEVIMLEVPCGFCMTGHCSSCKAELYWERKLYMCGCKKCCDGHKPSVGRVRRKRKSKTTQDEDEEEL